MADGLVLVLEGVLQGLDLEDVVGDFLKVDLDFILLLFDLYRELAELFLQTIFFHGICLLILLDPLIELRLLDPRLLLHLRSQV